MNIDSIAAVASSMAQEKTMDAVSITMFKKALDMQGQSALTLIAAAQQTTAAQNLPPHLGNTINVTA